MTIRRSSTRWRCEASVDIRTPALQRTGCRRATPIGSAVLTASPILPAWQSNQASRKPRYSLRRDDSDFVVFCLAKREDAEAFGRSLRWRAIPSWPR